MHLWAGRVAANYTRLYNGERRHPHRGLELMGGPSETDQVVEALRFGWAFAEVRGRMRMGDPQHLTGARPDHALPLGDERSWLEQTIETEKVVQTLAEHLGLDFQRAE